MRDSEQITLWKYRALSDLCGAKQLCGITPHAITTSKHS